MEVTETNLENPDATVCCFTEILKQVVEDVKKTFCKQYGLLLTLEQHTVHIDAEP